MNRQTLLIQTGLLVAALLTAGAAQSSLVVEGIAVGTLSSKGKVGSTRSTDNAIEYYIPLGVGRSGTYGHTDVTDASRDCTTSHKSGTCSDYGLGTGYDAASALTMNLYFNLSGLSNRDNAIVDIWFEDLDLEPENDPDWFYESVSFTATNGIKSMDLGPYKDDSGIPAATTDPFTWSLSLSSLGTLGDDFWIQLGFGSFADLAPGSKVWNTPEYLKATISSVPVPAAFWLFGTALIGFVGMSRRTKVS